MTRVAIIGGGAAGMFCAANLSPEFETTVFEAGESALRKVCASGGGRCNFTNENADAGNPADFYPRGGGSLKKPLKRFGAADARKFFRVARGRVESRGRRARVPRLRQRPRNSRRALPQGGAQRRENRIFRPRFVNRKNRRRTPCAEIHGRGQRAVRRGRCGGRRNVRRRLERVGRKVRHKNRAARGVAVFARNGYRKGPRLARIVRNIPRRRAFVRPRKRAQDSLARVASDCKIRNRRARNAQIFLVRGAGLSPREITGSTSAQTSRQTSTKPQSAKR